MHNETFFFYHDAERYALLESERHDAHAIISRHRISGLWYVSLFEA